MEKKKIYTDKEFRKIIEALPKSWEDVSIRQYQKILKLTLQDKYEEYIEFAKIFHPMDKSLDLAQLAYLNNYIERNILSDNSTYGDLPLGYKIKSDENISYQEWVEIIQIKDNYFSDENIKKYFNLLTYNGEEVVYDADKYNVKFLNQVFFSLMKFVKQSTKKHIRKTRKILLRQTIQMIWNQFLVWIKKPFSKK